MTARGPQIVRAAFVVAILAVTAPLAVAALHANSATVQPALTTDLGPKPLFDLTKMRPGVTTSRCVTVIGRTRTAPSVALYGSHKSFLLDHYLELTVTRGHTGGSWCGGFTPDRAGAIYSGVLSRYPRTVARALVDHAPLGAGRQRVYRFSVRLIDSSRAEGLHSDVAFFFTAGRR